MPESKRPHSLIEAVREKLNKPDAFWLEIEERGRSGFVTYDLYEVGADDLKVSVNNNTSDTSAGGGGPIDRRRRLSPPRRLHRQASVLRLMSKVTPASEDAARAAGHSAAEREDPCIPAACETYQQLIAGYRVGDGAAHLAQRWIEAWTARRRELLQLSL
ncbi:hypothetical protein [Sphingosinicella sp. BN140058]|uniref:hypothetical protein n=1 Tax=Sphingosinicella sp. BN140058 TaxID=1892855 RepID=UPI0010105111|nr:hypothetical protein [Sphingosinicella sp. BN140058]QAY80352.1 hypothetical protein ETR14_27300 [Sphingosinicella sp. BN140058]